MPSAPARPFQSWSTTADGIPRVIRYDKPALAATKLEQLGTALRIRLCNLDSQHHPMFSVSRLKQINGRQGDGPHAQRKSALALALQAGRCHDRLRENYRASPGTREGYARLVNDWLAENENPAREAPERGFCFGPDTLLSPSRLLLQNVPRQLLITL
jgi:hypothetical protein